MVRKALPYWEGYFSYYWDHNPGIHDRYKDKDDFLYEGYNTVRNVYDLAKKSLEEQSKPKAKMDNPDLLFTPKIGSDLADRTNSEEPTLVPPQSRYKGCSIL